MKNLLYLFTFTVGVSAAIWWANETFQPFTSTTFAAKSMTMSEYCETEVFHLGIPAEVASAIKLTIENVDAKSMKVEIESATNDPVDLLILNNSTGPITGSPAISEIDSSVPGKLSRTLTWTDAAPREVQLNVLWSKQSFAGNWQLIPGPDNITVLFEATCDDDGGGGPTEPIQSEYCRKEVRHLGIEAEVASAIFLTIENVDEFSMRVEIESANNDPVDDLILNNSFGPITGSPAISDIDSSVPGKLSRTLTWANSIVTNVELNILWSKQSTPGNWQLVPVPAPGNISVPFAATCDGGGVTTDPNIIAFPISFECEFTDYAFLEFGGAPTQVIDNPDASGINTSAKVAAMTKVNGAATFAGAILTADSPIDFSISKVFKMKVWSPKSGIIVKLKLENLTNGAISDEIDATTTTTNTWEELTFDFSAKDVASKSLQKVIVFFDFGNGGDGSIYYFDDIIQEGNNAVIPCEGDGGGGTVDENTIVFPVDFECAFIENYISVDFEGTFTEIINNPDASGINTSAKVAKTTKGNGAAVFAGSIVTLEDPIDFSISKVIKVKVWSPKAQSTVRLKLENLTNGGIANELDAITTVANTWQELTFDFSGTDANTKSLQKIIIFFDFGNTGDGSVYYWDDVTQVGNTGTTNCQEPPVPTAPTVAAIVPPVCETAIGIFSDANTQLEGTDFFPNWGQNPPVVVTIEDIAGGKVLKYANFSYQGIQLANAIDVSDLTTLHIDVWSVDDSLVNIYPISPGPIEKGFPLNLTKGEWTSFDIPLTAFSDVVDLKEIVQFKFDGGTGVETIFIDNLYFYGECYVVPACPQLVWADEFDGTSLNLNNWTPLTGDGCDINLCGWGNNELQWYQPQNAVVSNGSLKITAKRESVGGRDYTSARLITKDKQDFTYGRFEASIKLPEGQGIWPAFWMFHTDAVYGPWPMSGEIDIMEYLGQDKDRVFGTLHHGDLVPNNRETSGDFRLVKGDFTERFYEFAVEWEENEIRWYVDDYLYLTLRPENIAPDFWPFNQDFHLLLNMAVGGNLPGNPDATTTFPQTMEVDYVRVYKGRFAHMTGNQKVDYQAPGEVYTVANAGTGSTYNWTVDGGSIVEGQGTNQITVNWGEENQNAKVSVTTTSECGVASTINLDVIVDVQRVAVSEIVLENFDDEALITFLNTSGTFVDNTANPAPSTLNGSALVGKYTRNGEAQFDNIQYSTAVITDASLFTSGSKTFYLDVYTDAPIGTPLLLQLENSTESLPTNFPNGRHSRYQAITTAQNAWQRLAFTFLDRPDGATSNTGVDRIVFLFNPNTFTDNVYYYDNFEKYCTDEEGKCFDDTDFSLADPCNCSNPKNVKLPNGTFLFEDKLRVDASSFVAPVVTLASQDGNLLNATGNPIDPATATFTDLGGGIFELQFYTKPNTTSTVTVEVNGIQRTFTTTSCTPCVAPTAVPTMGEWALLIFSLFIINLILVLFYQREQQMVLGN